MKKKKFIIFSIIGFVIVTSGIALLIGNLSGFHLKPYDKYELSIIINTLKDDKNNSTTIHFKTDGKTSKATSSNSYREAFLIDNKLKYLDNETVYSYQVENFYDDLIEHFTKIKKADKLEERESYINYSVLLNKDQLNKILESLCFQIKASQSSVAKLSARDNRISSVNLSIKDIDGYDKIDVMMNFSELPENYEISTKVLENVHRPYKQEVASKNIFAMTGEEDEK